MAEWFKAIYLGQTSCRRKVVDVMNSLQCFSTYAAVMYSKYPEKVREP